MKIRKIRFSASLADYRRIIAPGFNGWARRIRLICRDRKMSVVVWTFYVSGDLPSNGMYGHMMRCFKRCVNGI